MSLVESVDFSVEELRSFMMDVIVDARNSFFSGLYITSTVRNFVLGKRLEVRGCWIV
jgi:hypothetical protein